MTSACSCFTAFTGGAMTPWSQAPSSSICMSAVARRQHWMPRCTRAWREYVARMLGCRCRPMPGASAPRPAEGALERMPKIVDHEQRRNEIALVACRVVAEYGFDQATIVPIARQAGYTTGMVAHYFDTKQDIIVAALRLILRRIEERLNPDSGGSEPDLL